MSSFKIKTSEYNTSNLKDLAGSLNIALSQIYSSGASMANFNATNITTKTINITSNASTGYVLTSINSSGTAQWEALPQGLSQQVITITGTTVGHIWSTDKTTNITFSKTGKVVIITIPSISAISNTNSTVQNTSTITLPLAYNASSLYTGDPTYPIIIINNGSTLNGLLDLSFSPGSTTTSLSFSITTSTGNTYGGSGFCGFASISIPYITDA